MPQIQIVEVKLAYVWDCENCGAENFERAVVHEFSPQEASEITGVEGERPETGNWMTCPDHVKCKHCGWEFEAKHFRSDDGESE